MRHVEKSVDANVGCHVQELGREVKWFWLLIIPDMKLQKEF
jgi:hypothetical protein